MARNTIGQFIAALRKANGLTQQDIADRLHVSNKAVSRWERDECAPDLSLIPALAEMFGVTCDELLKGERIAEKAVPEKKVDKQIKALILRTLSSFKTTIWIAIAAAILGLVCMFGISYGFYRPVIGFAVMLLFETCAFALTGIAVSRTRDLKTDNELFQLADSALKEKFHKALGAMSFAAFFTVLAVLLLSLPLILVNAASNYLNAVLTLGSYFTYFFLGIFVILAIIYLKCKDPYIAWVTENPEYAPVQQVKNRHRMTWLQVGLTVLAGILFLLAPYFDDNPREISVPQLIFVFAGLGCLAANAAVFILFLIKDKAHRKRLFLPGLRNALFIPSGLIVSQTHTSGWHTSPKVYGSTSSKEIFTRYSIWSAEYLLCAVALALAVFLLLTLVEEIMKNRQK